MGQISTVRRSSDWRACLRTLLLLVCLLFSASSTITLAGGPPEMVEVIVQAHSAAAAAAWARGRGGEVTHDLEIINGVAVRMPAPALKGLERAPGIRIHKNQDVWVSQAVGGQTVRDEFNVVSYSNNDGTATWAGSWSELNDRGSPKYGDVTITSNRLQFRETGNGASRALNLSGSRVAVLSFDFVSVDNGNDYFVVEVSGDGGATYAQLEEILPTGRGQRVSRSYSLQDHIPLTANVVVRFRVSAGFGGWGQYASVDNVQIAYAYPPTDYPALVGADQLHAQGITGGGVTVAVLDTGFWSNRGLVHDTSGQARVPAYYDAVNNVSLSWPSGPPQASWDDNGHGSHVASIVLSSLPASDGTYNGVAPDANLLPVRAFDWEGKGTYADIIRAVEFVVNHRDQYNIRVLNLSFSAQPQSYYWDDPLNQAVMRAWQAGIVVVAAAGNRGPEPMTIGAPGNVPYVVTVGAFTDNHTPGVLTDDGLCSFSSVGPTVEAFVKPELVAPGAHMLGLMPHEAYLPEAHPDWSNGSGNYYTVSGTSQATAVTSGIVALMLQRNPGLTPDEVKCKLIASAKPAVNAYGEPAYSVFQQGAGLVDAYAAAYSAESGCANRGIDIDIDLAGIEHYSGRANRDEFGDYALMGLDGFAWGGGFAWGDGFAWGEGFAWGSGFAWGDAFAWGDGMAWGDAFAWGDAVAWGDGFAWGDSYVSSGTGWVPAE